MKKHILCIFIFDLFINSIAFLPIGNRDELTDFLVVLPAIILLNIFVCYILLRIKNKLGYYFAANVIIESILFITIHTYICKYMAKNYSTIYHFTDSNNTFVVKMYNSSNIFGIGLNENKFLGTGKYEQIGDKYNLYISKWLLGADEYMDISNNYPQYTLVISNDSLYNWNEKPISLKKEEKK